MIKGNSSSKDDENERSERSGLLSANIGDYSEPIGGKDDAECRERRAIFVTRFNFL